MNIRDDLRMIVENRIPDAKALREAWVNAAIRASGILRKALEYERMQAVMDVKHSRKPNGLDLSDWRMALRRKLNGDTR